ncbi:S8 family serine peptidase [Leucothrix arctica]|uniref:Peptidase S8 and S53 subtilisin kexin sedolisin n=1 Tax=Leucothrix arctica TaxID=1481894 RepID=A0A317CJ76_9GAMM|nr:S8 family serine peptidase [Leucothrix arctica]PWQ96382.1 peptidase S8 and S53 subtilisin kexin sedolisin [Leucothrix arctica]
MSCRKNMESSNSLVKNLLSNRVFTTVFAFGISCLVSTPLFAHNSGEIHTHSTLMNLPANTAAGPQRTHFTQRNNNINYYGFLPIYQIAPPLTIITPPKAIKPKRNDFVKDEILLVYDFGLKRKEIEAITEKYKLKRKSGMAIGALRKGVIIADTLGQNPLDLMEDINKVEKDFVANTNNYYSLAANNTSVSPPKLNYPLAQTGVGRAQQVSRGRGITIGMVDTPVDIRHPALRGVNIEQHLIADPKTTESRVHGTSIAGILVSKDPQIGVAPEAKLLSVSAFSSRPGHPKALRGKSTDIVAAIAYCIQKKVDILNLSFTGGRDKFVESIILNAIQRGITVVAAGGNKGKVGSTVYPAVIEGVIGVTAVDRNQRLFAQADRGRFIDIAAPGVGILTLAPQGKFQISTGTSMAAAHLSGVLALLKSYQHQYPSEQLNLTTIDLGREGWDQEFGNGLVNASAALRLIGAPLPY